ncbi:hypothetical protein GCM10027344_36680 [Spelaeicoccus albus]
MLSLTNRLGVVVAVVLAAAAASFGVGVPAHAAQAPTSETTKSVDVRQVTGGTTVTVHIEFDKPVPRKKALKEAGRRAGAPARLSRMSGSTTVLHCGQPEVRSTDKGSLHLLHPCDGSTVKWGYRINTSLQKLVVGKVHETGMKYTHAGSSKSGTAHTASKSHYFDGKFSPAGPGSTGKYRDSLKFLTDYGFGGVSRTTITVRGSFTVA